MASVNLLYWDGSSKSLKRSATSDTTQLSSIGVGTAASGTAGQLTVAGSVLFDQGDAIRTITAATSTASGALGARITVQGGEGAPDVANPAGSGGVVTIQGGNGGAAATGQDAGFGGAVHIYGGVGGVKSTSGAAADGGVVFIKGGDASSTGNANGGGVVIDGGSNIGSGSLGTVLIGTNSTTGSLTLGRSGQTIAIASALSGSLYFAHAGTSHIFGGSSPSFAGTTADSLLFVGGSGANGNGSTAPGSGGDVYLTAGYSGSIVASQTASGVAGGNVTITAGHGSSALASSNAPAGAGGITAIAGGAGGSNSAGGSSSYREGAAGGVVTITGGAGSNSNWTSVHDGSGGGVTLQGGVTGAVCTDSSKPASGGSVTIVGGSGAGAYNVGGDVSIDAGAGYVTGSINVGLARACPISVGASGSSLGFFSATPVVKQTLSSDTLANLLIALRAYGLIV